jgi:hypothetical protein
MILTSDFSLQPLAIHHPPMSASILAILAAAVPLLVWLIRRHLGGFHTVLSFVLPVALCHRLLITAGVSEPTFLDSL